MSDIATAAGFRVYVANPCRLKMVTESKTKNDVNDARALARMTRETRLPDLRIRQSPRTRHPDFEMYQYNCTEEAAKFFDRSAYPWDFAVPRQGFKDYGMRETDPAALDRRVQWIFFKAKNRKVLSRLKKLDFNALSRKNSTIPGFGKADVVEEYERLYPSPAGNSPVQSQLDL